MTCAIWLPRWRYRRESPDVRDGDAVVVEQGGDHGGAHAFAFGLRARGLVDDLVGAGDGITQHDRGARQTRAAIDGAEVLARQAFADQVGDGLDGDAAGDFAGVIAAHAIGKHQEPHVRIGGNGVFVVFADTPGVGLADERELAFQTRDLGHTSRRFSALFFDHTCAQHSKSALYGRKATARFPAPAITYQQCGRVHGAISHTSPRRAPPKSTI